jgi:peptidoglycan/xylan/chitin deacetylase (PgdA/CDA1 family)
MTRSTTERVAVSLVVVLTLVLGACGGDDDSASPIAATQTTASGTSGGPTQPASGNSTTPTATTSNPAPDATATSLPDTAHVLTPEELQQYQPNELGQIPILEYHHFGDTSEQFVRTPDQFRGDLQWLYDHNFYVVPLHDVLTFSIDAPAGKRPVVLTFDDSPASQFRLLPLDSGRFGIDPNCAIGIMEEFFGKYPDFGRGGVFAVVPDKLFDWTPTVAEPDQTQYTQIKFQWLVDNGYEFANHSRDHVNLSELDNEQIMYQLAEANKEIQALAPGAAVASISLPYGMYPPGGDDTLFRGFDYQGRHYAWQAALQVGANPTVAPISTEYDPYAMARIQAFDDELYNHWFPIFEQNPGILYVSDGNPNTVTVPNDLHPWLVGTLDESKIGDRELIRF